LDGNLTSGPPKLDLMPGSVGLRPADEFLAADKSASTRQTERRWNRARLWAASGEHLFALIDQAVVSGASFLSTVIVGRWGHSSELGTYSIAISVLVSLVVTQESLVAWPYTIQRHETPEFPAEHAGGFLIQSVLLSAFAAAALITAGLSLSSTGVEQHLIALAWVLAATTPFALLREFARRISFAHLKMKQALLLDLAAAVVQLAGLGLLVWTGELSAASACAAIGVACAVTGIGWLYLVRKRFAFCWHRVPATLYSSWRVAKWLFANQIALSFQSYIGYWILAWTKGVAVAGVYTACMSIALFSNPFILGSSNSLVPRAALAWVEGGPTRLRRDSGRALIPLVAGMTVFCAIVFLAGDRLASILFSTNEYAGQGETITVLALAMLALAVGLPTTSALTSMGRADVVLWAGLGSAILTCLLVGGLGTVWGLVGAAYALLAGNLAKSAACWGVFVIATSQTGSRSYPVRRNAVAAPKAVVAVLAKFSQAFENGSWAVEKLGEGDQAEVYRVGHANNRDKVWLNHRNLAVKVYKGRGARAFTVARREFASIFSLYTALNGRTAGGWKVSIPVPLYFCESPLAIVMSVVAGEKLNNMLDEPEVMTSLPRAIAAVLRPFWSEGKSLSDLNLDNVLCNAGTRELAFIDPNLSMDEMLSDDVPRNWYPVSHNLARLLYETAVQVRRHIGRHRTLLLKTVFVASVLRACADACSSPEERELFFGETEACAKEYLKAVQFSLSLRGLWQIVLRRLAAGRIEAIVDTARCDPGCSDGSPALAAVIGPAQSANWSRHA
jgi:O-antigen/teichoic acid export membrane protein